MYDVTMITLLSKLFIKENTNYNSPGTRTAYGILCGIVGILLNLLLFTGKFLAGYLSGSIAITADAFNNLSDAASSFVTLIGFKLASAEPDTDHPFGHGRIEYLSGLIVSGMILFMAFELIRDSVMRIIKPQPTTFGFLPFTILLVSIVIKLYMSFYNRQVSIKIHSAAMKATATDSLSDAASTFVVLCSMLLEYFTTYKIDGFCGILVGLFIFYAGINAAKDTINPLLGQPADEEFVAQVKTLVLSHKEIIGIHDLIVHDYGPGRVMVCLHAEVPAEGNIVLLHDVIDNIENELKTNLRCDAIIHMDPIETKNELTNTLRNKTKEILAEIDSSLEFHDFRIVTGPSHTNLIYDVLLPYKYKLSDEAVLKLLAEKTSEKLGKNYYIVVKIDKG